MGNRKFPHFSHKTLEAYRVLNFDPNNLKIDTQQPNALTVLLYVLAELNEILAFLSFTKNPLGSHRLHAVKQNFVYSKKQNCIFWS
jgi:hypothetical protein